MTHKVTISTSYIENQFLLPFSRKALMMVLRRRLKWSCMVRKFFSNFLKFYTIFVYMKMKRYGVNVSLSNFMINFCHIITAFSFMLKTIFMKLIQNDIAGLFDHKTIKWYYSISDHTICLFFMLCQLVNLKTEQYKAEQNLCQKIW